MNTESWLNAATEKIRFAPDREAVKKELRDHLEDRRDALLARGLAAEEAETQATAAMGDPAELAQELGRLHSPWWGYIWRASQWGLLCAVFLIFGLATNDIAPAFEPIDEVHQYLIYSGTDFFGEPRILERTVYTPDKKVVTGDYVIHADTATLDRIGFEEGDAFQVLYLDFSIRTKLPGNPLALYSAVTQVTDSAGNIYSSGVPAKDEPPQHRSFRDEDHLLWSQKARLMLWHLPEDVQWVELIFGCGEYRRTLRVELNGEAAS